MLIFADFGQDIQQAIFNAAEMLFYPVLIAAVVCLIWVLIELGWLVYELYLRFRYRDLEALEIRTLRARQAFADGKPRRAYRYLQENNYSLVVARFLFDLIRNYQTQRLAVKPLKLLQEYEFHTVKRLERTRILVRLGPMLGLMGTLIPLSPALAALAEGDTQQLADKLRIAFSVTVIGLLIGGLAFVVSIVRDRIYSQDISDLEYLLELLEGGPKRLRAGRRKDTEGRWVDELASGAAAEPLDEGASMDERVVTGEGAASREVPPSDEAASADAVEDQDAGTKLEPTPRPDTLPASALVTPSNAERPSLDQLASFEGDTIPWNRDDDPFASLGPAEEPGERG
jgi:biopolymer transport protein ExbB/TolQ